MHGMINLHKPVGITSAKALYRVRPIVGQRKSGHAGTLDPGASGVLVICLGQATKLVERIMDQPKVYRASARLDVTSESFDSDRPQIPAPIGRIPSDEEVVAAFSSFVGTIEQAPPAISAVKVGGRPAYKLAGAGGLELLPRPVRVDWIRVLSYTWPAVDFELCCGRGFYVRALIRDVGQCLGVGGCLTGLVRLRVGPFALDEAWLLDSLSTAAPEQFVIPLDRARQLLERDRDLLATCP